MPNEPEGTQRGRVRTWLASAGDVLRRAAQEYLVHRTRRFAASLAYYSIFALVPTLFLALTIVAAFFGREATEGRVADALEDIVGIEAATRLDEAIADLWESSNTSGFAIITAAVVIYSASSLFIAWRDSLEAIWRVPYRPGISMSIRRRIYGALAPVAIGIVLSAIVLVEVLTAVAGDLVTSPVLDAILNTMRTVSPTVGSVLVLGLLYRLSTRRRPGWRDVWTGAIPASLALAVLAWGYGLYVRFFGGSSAAGAAGTVILGLAFIYYSAQLLLYGGEIVSAAAARRGHPISRPADEADDEDAPANS